MELKQVDRSTCWLHLPAFSTLFEVKSQEIQKTWEDHFNLTVCKVVARLQFCEQDISFCVLLFKQLRR